MKKTITIISCLVIIGDVSATCSHTKSGDPVPTQEYLSSKPIGNKCSGVWTPSHNSITVVDAPGEDTDFGKITTKRYVYAGEFGTTNGGCPTGYNIAKPNGFARIPTDWDENKNAIEWQYVSHDTPNDKNCTESA